MAIDPRTEKIFERIDEAVREVATLFVALAPLDVVLGAERPDAIRNGLIFVAIGVSLFILILKGNGSVDDFLIVMGAVVFVCLIGIAYVWFSTPPRDSKRNQ